MTIKDRACKLVEQFNTSNPFELAQCLDAIVVKCPIGGARGFYQFFQKTNVIYIDEGLTEHDQKFVCAHELGHMLLHRSINAVFMDTKTYFELCRYETEANAFAMDLLVPDELLAKNQEFTICQLSKLLGYSEELIGLRMRHYGRK